MEYVIGIAIGFTLAQLLDIVRMARKLNQAVTKDDLQPLHEALDDLQRQVRGK